MPAHAEVGSSSSIWGKVMKKIVLALTPFTAVIVVFVIFVFSLLAFIWPIDAISLANAGLFGDSFGALNALFSGLGFAGLILTLIYQQTQLKVQQAELNTTQIELRRQSELFDQQKFDESFFQLLRLFRENLNSLYQKSPSGNELRGIDLLAERLGRLRSHLKSKGMGPFPFEENRRVVYVWEFWKTAQNAIGRQTRYIDTLGALIDWVDESCPKHVEKGPYWNMVSSQLTSIECNYLFYQIMLSPEDHSLRKKFDIESSLFQKISLSISNVEHRKIYSWVMQLDLTSYRQGRSSPISPSVVSKAKRSLKSLAIEPY